MCFSFVTVCNQFARSVVAMLGAVAPDSFDTLHSYANTFQMPFVTPWFPEKVILIFYIFIYFSACYREGDWYIDQESIHDGGRYVKKRKEILTSI